MRRSAVVMACLLLVVLHLPVRSEAAGWSSAGLGPVGVGLGTGVGVFLPYLVPVQDVSAELVLADRFAIGGKALFVLGDSSDAAFLPFITLGSRRSRPSAAYLTAALLAGSTAGTLAVGYEAAVRGPVRLYVEAGAVAAVGDSGGVGLPYGQLGVRLRF